MTIRLLNDLISSLSLGEDAFATLRGIEPKYDHRGRMIFTSGRESVVFNIAYRGEEYALKCYLSEHSSRAERCRYLHTHDPQGLIVHPCYFHNELWTEQGAVDVALYKWTEGYSLDWNIRKALHDNNTLRLRHLLSSFINLAISTLEGEWRHGDPKPENIIVRPSGEMIWVDCDALYAPSLAPSEERGTPHWIHSARQGSYDAHIDDYGIALLAVSLAALILKPQLFADECGVAMPALGNRNKIAELLAPYEHLTTLHEALYSQTYIINNLSHNLRCIAHLLPAITKQPL